MDREEELLRQWHPGFFRFESAEKRSDLDDFLLTIFRNTQRQHADLIAEWAKAFLDYHPVLEQRTPEAIKDWSYKIDWTHDEYGQEYAAIACRLAITIATEDQQKDATIDAIRARIYGRQKALSIYDGDLSRARPHYRVGPGWHGILDQLVTELSIIPTVGFFSASQKWGGLKVTLVCDDDFRAAAEAVTEIACQKALVTCEICGRPGELRKERWWKVLCDEHLDTRSVKEYLQARFPDLVDDRTKITIRASWLKHAWSFCERVEAMTLDDKLSGTRVRLHDVYERGGEIIIDYDTMPPVVDGHMSTSDPRVLLKLRHIAEETALDSRLDGKE